MDVTSYLLGKKAGGGSSAVLIDKDISTNGTYNASSDEADGYKKVVVNVQPSGATTDWSQIGFTSEPGGVTAGIDYAKQIAQDWDSSITSMQNKYQYDEYLTFFPLVDTSHVTTMRNAFLGAKLLGIPLIDTSNVLLMQNAFQNTMINNIPLIDTSNVVSMEYAFKECIYLKQFPNLNMSNCGSCTQMFAGCTALENVPDIFHFTSNERYAYYTQMFSGCTNLKNVGILDLVRVAGGGLQNMFSGCTSLTNESLNNIMRTCINANNGSYGTKTLAHLGISSAQAQICTTLSNYQDFLDAGWTTGY